LGKSKQQRAASIRRHQNKRRKKQRDRRTRLYRRCFDFLFAHLGIMLEELQVDYEVTVKRTEALLLVHTPFPHTRFTNRPTSKRVNLITDPFRENMWIDEHRPQYAAQLVRALATLFLDKHLYVYVTNHYGYDTTYAPPGVAGWNFKLGPPHSYTKNYAVSELDSETHALYKYLKKRWRG